MSIEKRTALLVASPPAPEVTDPLYYLQHSLIAPCLKKYNYEITQPTWRQGHVSGYDMVVRDLIAYDLVIFEITDNSPSTLYKVGLRHMTGRPSILFSFPKPSQLDDIKYEGIIHYHPADATLHMPAQEELAWRVAAIDTSTPPHVGRPVMGIMNGEVMINGTRVTSGDLDRLKRKCEAEERRSRPRKENAGLYHSFSKTPALFYS